MNINESTLLGGAMTLLATGFGWAFKRQINRIDALEKANTEAQVTRAQTAEVLHTVKDSLEKHMVSEETNMREVHSTLQTLSTNVAVLVEKTSHSPD